jgi:nitrite reductase (NADH) small subunit
VSEEADWLPLCRLDEIFPKTAKHFDTPAGGIGVFHMADGRLFAIEDRCPHAFALLSFGLMDQQKDSVMCPLHGWRLGLADGEVQFPPNSGMAVCTYAVRVMDGIIQVSATPKTKPASNMSETRAS